MDHATTEFTHARSLFERAEYAAAIERCERVLHLSPGHAQAHELLGLSCVSIGRLADGVVHLRQAVEREPGDPALVLNLAAALLRCGCPEQAAGQLREALARFAPSPDLFYNLALAQSACHDNAAAVASYRRCLELDPRFAEAHNNLGSELERLGRDDEAEAHFREALRLKPGYLRALTNLGGSQRRHGLLPESAATLEEALRLAPDYPPALCSSAHTFFAQGLLQQADRMLARATEVAPERAAVHAQRAEVLYGLHRYRDALASCERAIALRPQLAEAWNLRGMALGQLDQFEEALASYAHALDCAPGYASARWNQALLYLTLGRLREGWPLFEARFQVSGIPQPTRPPSLPRWSGDAELRGKRILVAAEYGLGDTIHFGRYLRRLQALGAQPIFEVQPSLIRLMGRLGSGIEVLGHGQSAGDADFHCPLLSLPLAFGTELATIPAESAYLSAEPQAIELWRATLAPLSGYRVGIAWRGNPEAEKSALRGRSIPLHCFGALLSVPGIRLVSLQKGAAPEELAALRAGGIASFSELLDPGPDAFVDTAAIMMSLDLVITCDTSIAHLAGALGLPVWVALHTTADWRWFRDRSDSPWYPTMRLFRQRAAGDWGTVFAEIAARLREHVG